MSWSSVPSCHVFVSKRNRDWPYYTGTRSSSSCELRRWGSGGTGVSAFIPTSHSPSLSPPALLVGGARAPLALPWSFGGPHVLLATAEGPGSPDTCLAMAVLSTIRRSSACPGCRSYGKVGGLRPALPMLETFGLSRVHPTDLMPVQKSEAFGLPCPCRRPSVCP